MVHWNLPPSPHSAHPVAPFPNLQSPSGPPSSHQSHSKAADDSLLFQRISHSTYRKVCFAIPHPHRRNRSPAPDVTPRRRNHRLHHRLVLSTSNRAEASQFRRGASVAYRPQLGSSWKEFTVVLFKFSNSIRVRIINICLLTSGCIAFP